MIKVGNEKYVQIVNLQIRFLSYFYKERQEQ